MSIRIGDEAPDFTADTTEGKIRFPGVPTWFSKTPGKVAGPTAHLGQHTAEVLGEPG